MRFGEKVGKMPMLADQIWQALFPEESPPPRRWGLLVFLSQVDQEIKAGLGLGVRLNRPDIRPSCDTTLPNPARAHTHTHNMAKRWERARDRKHTYQPTRHPL